MLLPNVPISAIHDNDIILALHISPLVFFYWNGLLVLITAGISNYNHYKVWDEISYPFPNFNSSLLKFGNEWVISSHILLGMSLLIHAVIKVKPH